MCTSPLPTFLLGVCKPFTHIFILGRCKAFYTLSYLVWAHPLPTFILGVCKPFTYFHTEWNLFTYFHTWCGQALYPLLNLVCASPLLGMCTPFTLLSYFVCASHLPTFILAVCKPITHFYTWLCPSPLPTFILGVKTFYSLSYLVWKLFTYFHTWHVQVPLSFLVNAKKETLREPAWLPRLPWGCMDGLLEDTQSKVLAHSQFPSYLTL